LLRPPMNTTKRHSSDATVKAMGIVIAHILPILPMFAELFIVVWRDRKGGRAEFEVQVFVIVVAAAERKRRRGRCRVADGNGRLRGKVQND
jgi:hypothetical protein